MLINQIKRINETVLECLNENDELKIVKKFTVLGQTIIQADYGFVWLNSSESFDLELGYISPDIPFIPAKPAKGGKNYSAMTYDTPDYVEDMKSENDKYNESKYIKSYVIIPIRFKNEVYGTMVLCFKEKQIFSDEKKVLTVYIGNSVAQAITIHRLFVKEQEARLLAVKQEAHFKALLENSHEIIMLVDRNGYIQYISSSIEHICGISVKEILGHRAREYLHNNDDVRVVKFLNKTIENPGAIHVEEFNFKHKNGSVMCFEATAFNMLDNPNVNGVVVNISDITEKKKAEALKETERLLSEEQLKTEFIANATHEIRTPLAIIRGNAELALLKDKKMTRSCKKAFKAINYEIEHLSNMIADLTMLTSKDASIREGIILGKVDLGEIIKHIVKTVHILAKRKKISIKLKIDSHIPMMGDKIYLEKLFLNLFRNAINYGKVGGMVKIESRIENGKAKVTVSDNGIGIDEDDLPYIFNRFFRADKSHHPDGNSTGLGLAIVKWIVTAHEGMIDVKSKIGKGTEFVVTLPIFKKD